MSSMGTSETGRLILIFMGKVDVEAIGVEVLSGGGRVSNVVGVG